MLSSHLFARGWERSQTAPQRNRENAKPSNCGNGKLRPRKAQYPRARGAESIFFCPGGLRERAGSGPKNRRVASVRGLGRSQGRVTQKPVQSGGRPPGLRLAHHCKTPGANTRGQKHSDEEIRAEDVASACAMTPREFGCTKLSFVPVHFAVDDGHVNSWASQ